MPAWRQRYWFALLAVLLLVTSGSRAHEQDKNSSPAPPQTTNGGQPAASSTGGEDPGSTKASTGTSPASVRISPGDLLEVRVFDVPEMTQEVRVNTAGQILLPLIGTVQIAGLTEMEAQQHIADLLKQGQYMNDPQVSVFTKEYTGQGISVLGEVTRPGVYPPAGTPHLFELLSAAGGLSPRAGRTVSITHREHPDDPEVVQISSDLTKSTEANVQLLPGDTVIVSRAGVVYVVGDVNRPSGLVMENGEQMTVLQALALAGGTASTASMKGVKVLRRTPSGVQEIPVPLQPILSAKVPDMALQAEDVLYVPGSRSKHAAKRGIDSILAIATGVAIRY